MNFTNYMYNIILQLSNTVELYIYIYLLNIYGFKIKLSIHQP